MKTLVRVSFRNAITVSKVIAMDVVNEVRRLCFGGALLRALFFFKLKILKNCQNFKKYISYECRLPTLRVGLSVTRLKIHWALQFETLDLILWTVDRGLYSLDSAFEMLNSRILDQTIFLLQKSYTGMVVKHERRSGSEVR